MEHNENIVLPTCIKTLFELHKTIQMLLNWAYSETKVSLKEQKL